MPHFKRVVTSKQQPYFILKDEIIIVGESIEAVTKHETSWLLDSEECDDVDNNLGESLQNNEAALIRADENNIIILSTASSWYDNVSNFKAWNFLEQRNWVYYINTLV